MFFTQKIIDASLRIKIYFIALYLYMSLIRREFKMKKVIMKLVLGMFILACLLIGTDSHISYAATGNPTKTISDVNNKKNHNFYYAKKIPTKTKIRGKIESHGAEHDDYYKYKSTEKGYVRFKVSRISNPGATLRLCVYDANNILLSDNNFFENDALSFKLNYKKGTTYYVKVSSYSEEPTNYYISAIETKNSRMESEKNDTFARATALSLNKSSSGLVLTDEDIDYFKFKAPKAGIYKFTFNYSTGNDIGYGWDMYLYKSNGNKIKSKENVISKTTFTRKMEKGETLYLRITNGSGNPSKILGELYTVKVTKK